jgi:hypothetical protein
MQRNEPLNDVVIVMGRSLLQYMGQAWPWTPGKSQSLRQALDELIVAQGARIARLTDLLDSRRWTIDFGSFPDFTDLHYLAVEFVLPHLAEDERSVIREIEAARSACSGDFEGQALLDEILAGERAALARLEQLARPQPAGSAA